MNNTTENHSESSRPVRILAAALFVVMMGSGYAISTQVEAMDESNVAIPAVPATPYFPAQYVNQGQGSEAHIQAF